MHILIVIMLAHNGYGGTPESVVAEFSSRQDCENARGHIEKAPGVRIISQGCYRK